MATGDEESAQASRDLQFDHGTLCVGDVEAAIEFYGRVLGLRQIERPDFGFPGAWFMAGSVPVHLTTGGLLRGANAPLNSHEAHLAFRMEKDLQHLVEKVRAAGAPVYESEDPPVAQRQVFVLDPWGNMLEFCQYGPEYPADTGN
jgi:catechol 2,3-dioxygenase-like lactoylglutathione lyase family enzyme